MLSCLIINLHCVIILRVELMQLLLIRLFGLDLEKF